MRVIAEDVDGAIYLDLIVSEEEREELEKRAHIRGSDHCEKPKGLRGAADRRPMALRREKTNLVTE